MREGAYSASSADVCGSFDANRMMVLGFPEYEQQARRLSASLGARYATVQIHRFPDGESKVTLPASLLPEVIFCHSLNRPNDKLIELLLAAQAARQLGAARLTLVVPYLCYMRQDMAFQPGEAVSQLIIGRLLADLFDRVVTLDPHLHRIDTIEAAIPAAEAIALSASHAIGKYLAVKTPGAFILGPDEESAQWAQEIAHSAGLDFAVGCKVRLGDRNVVVELPAVDLRNRHVILVDDIVSTGETMIAAARKCLAAGASQVDAFVCHALFVEDAVDKMRQAGITDIESTDSVSHPCNALQLADLLAGAVQSGGTVSGSQPARQSLKAKSVPARAVKV
jgi:ribose-phosphate pyrophosphokinase